MPPPRNPPTVTLDSTVFDVAKARVIQKKAAQQVIEETTPETPQRALQRRVFELERELAEKGISFAGEPTFNVEERISKMEARLESESRARGYRPSTTEGLVSLGGALAAGAFPVTTLAGMAAAAGGAAVGGRVGGAVAGERGKEFGETIGEYAGYTVVPMTLPKALTQVGVKRVVKLAAVSGVGAAAAGEVSDAPLAPLLGAVVAPVAAKPATTLALETARLTREAALYGSDAMMTSAAPLTRGAVTVGETLERLGFPSPVSGAEAAFYQTSGRASRTTVNEMLMGATIPLKPLAHLRNLRKELAKTITGVDQIDPQQVKTSVLDLDPLNLPPGGVLAAIKGTGTVKPLTVAQERALLKAIEDLTGADRVDATVDLVAQKVTSAGGLAAYRNLLLTLRTMPDAIIEAERKQAAFYNRAITAKTLLTPTGERVLDQSTLYNRIHNAYTGPLRQLANLAFGAVGHARLSAKGIAVAMTYLNGRNAGDGFVLTTLPKWRENIMPAFPDLASMPMPKAKSASELAIKQQVIPDLASGRLTDETARNTLINMVMDFPTDFTFTGAAGRRQKMAIIGVKRYTDDLYNIGRLSFKVDFDPLDRAYWSHYLDLPERLTVKKQGGGLGELRVTTNTATGELTLTKESVFHIFNTQKGFTKERKFPYLANAMIKGYHLRADVVADPAQALANRTASAFRMMEDDFLLGEFQRLGVHPTEVSEILNTLASKLKDPAARRTSQFLGSIRALKFGMEVGFLGVQNLVVTAPYLLTNPLKVASIQLHILDSMLHPEMYNKWMTVNADRIVRFQRAGGNLGMQVLEVAPGEGRPWMEMPVRLPFNKGYATNPVRALNDAQFLRGMTVLKVELFDMLTEVYQKNSPINAALAKMGFAVEGKMDYGQAVRAAATHVDEILGGLDPKRAFLHAGRQFSERLLDLTPNFLRATVQTFNRAVAGGNAPEARLARGFLLRMYLFMASYGYLGTWFSTGERPDVAEKLNPVSGKFGVWETKTDNINLAGRFRKWFRFGAAPLDDLATNVILGKDERLATGRQAGQIVSGRLSLPLQAWKLIQTERSFEGTPVFTEEGPFSATAPWINPTTGLAVANVLIAPIAAEQLVTDMRAGTATAMTVIGALFGVSTYPVDQVRKNIQRVVTEELIALGATPKSAREQTLRYRPFEAKTDNGQIINLSKDDQDALWERVARRTGYADADGDLSQESLLIVRRFGEDPNDFTHKEVQDFLAGPAVFNALRNNSIAVRAVKKAAIEDINRRFFDGEITLRAAFDQDSTLSQGFRLMSRKDRLVFAGVLGKIEENWSRRPHSEKEVLFDTWMDMINSAVGPTGEIDPEVRRDAEKMIANMTTTMRKAWSEEFLSYEGNNQDEIGYVRSLRYDLLNITRPYHEAKYEVMGEEDRLLYDKWRSLEPRVQTIFAQQNSKVLRLDNLVKDRQRDLLLGRRTFSRLPIPDGHDPVLLELSLWFLTGQGGDPRTGGNFVNPKTVDLLRKYDAIDPSSLIREAKAPVREIRQGLR